MRQLVWPRMAMAVGSFIVLQMKGPHVLVHMYTEDHILQLIICMRALIFAQDHGRLQSTWLSLINIPVIVNMMNVPCGDADGAQCDIANCNER